MTTIGIISEYNPFHFGHLGHIEKSKEKIGGECAVVCVMSGNYVQRGDAAIFNKSARAKAAVCAGVDLVIELPASYALSSAEGFARAGVFLLEALGVCDVISFGSESGELAPLFDVAQVLISGEAGRLLSEGLGLGISYAAAQQRAADIIMGERAFCLRFPNNLLGIEYLKAITLLKSKLIPVTVTRTGGKHDSDEGFSASRLRMLFSEGKEPWFLMPDAAADVLREETKQNRGPVLMCGLEQAMLSRLRAAGDFSKLPDASEGLDNRFKRFSGEPTIQMVQDGIKTKRYAMSRIRRMLMCACLGITAEDSKQLPPYIRVLAMNETGKVLLSRAKKIASLPIITKPAYAKKLEGRARELFYKEAAATDFYALGYKDSESRRSGSEWRQSPYVHDKFIF